MSLAAAGRDPDQPDEKADGFRRASEAGEQIAIGAEPILVLGNGEKPPIAGDRTLGRSGLGGEGGMVAERRRKSRIEDERATEPGGRLIVPP